MCRCTPTMRTPFCGKMNCNWDDKVEFAPDSLVNNPLRDEVWTAPVDGLYSSGGQIPELKKQGEPIKLAPPVPEQEDDLIPGESDACRPGCGGVGHCIECSLEADQEKLDQLENEEIIDHETFWDDSDTDGAGGDGGL